MTNDKNNKIKATLAITRAKRALQICKVKEIKIIESALNQQQLETLQMMFIEAKWIYNHTLDLIKNKKNRPV